MNLSERFVPVFVTGIHMEAQKKNHFVKVIRICDTCDCQIGVWTPRSVPIVLNFFMFASAP